MKGINISCTSQISTAIIPSSREPQSSASSSSSASSTVSGSRAIDRHNPIITDERRWGVSKSTPATPCANPILHLKARQTPEFSPKPQQMVNPPVLIRKKSKKTRQDPRNNPGKPISMTYNDNEYQGKKNSSKPSGLTTKGRCSDARSGVNYISPPQSSRYLLDDSFFLDVLSDYSDPVLKSSKYDSTKEIKSKADVSKDPRTPTSSGSSNQVVVLRVSLHCRGCERKMKKHLSKMAGVTSFNIDFAAKKVTVIGDVTPLEVLASISKVKNAQFWKISTSSSSSIN